MVQKLLAREKLRWVVCGVAVSKRHRDKDDSTCKTRLSLTEMNKDIVNSLYVVDFKVDGSEVSFSQERKEEQKALAVAESPICVWGRDVSAS